MNTQLKIRNFLFTVLALIAGIVGFTDQTRAQDTLPAYLRDRGAGIPTSMFGTYIRRNELLVFPYFAYSSDHNMEYEFQRNRTFRGKYRDASGQIFIAYGVTDWLALEFETGITKASLKTSPADTASPAKIKESGLGDIEGQIRYRILKEADHHLEVFGFVEVTIPSQKNKKLIGDPDWDFRPGFGIVRGFSFGTVTFRTDLEYNRDDHAFDLGETSLEYLRRLSPSWLLFLAIEGGETGAPDDYGLNIGVRWSINDHINVKLDNALGFQSKSTDWAPQIGIMVSLPN